MRQSNIGQRNINLNVSNRVFVSRQRPNLREVRRALPGSKALKGYSRYGIPKLRTHSALLTNNMMAQLNNFRREVEQGQHGTIFDNHKVYTVSAEDLEFVEFEHNLSPPKGVSKTFQLKPETL